MCTTYSYVQFPGIDSTDTNVAINGLQATSSNSTVDDLVTANPQFFYQFGNSGQKTLHTIIQVNGVDVTLTTGSGTNAKSVTAIPATFIGGRPDDRR